MKKGPSKEQAGLVEAGLNPGELYYAIVWGVLYC